MMSSLVCIDLFRFRVILITRCWQWRSASDLVVSVHPRDFASDRLDSTDSKLGPAGALSQTAAGHDMISPAPLQQGTVFSCSLAECQRFGQENSTRKGRGINAID